MKIAIELNGIVRNINFQLLKYYKKDINPSFDEDNIDLNKTTILEDLPFEDKKSKSEFVFIDYPYEIFGCARVMEKNLSNTINNWLLELYDKDADNDIEFISFGENDLSVPSTYYFLSKIATRVRNVYFPKNKDNIWENYDVIITTNPQIVKNAPKGKVAILIKKNDNEYNCEYVFKTLTEAIENFPHQVAGNTKDNIWNKIKKIFN